MKTMMVLWKVWLIWAQQIRIKAHQYIDRAEAVMVTEEVAPNDFVRYDVNLEKRTCGCAHWQHYGIACKHTILVWEKYQEQLAERNGGTMEANAYLEARAFCLRRT